MRDRHRDETLMMDEKNLDHIEALGPETLIYPDVEFVVQNSQGDGRGIRIGADCRIYPRNRLVIGDLDVNRDAHITIGDHVLINAGGYLSGEAGLTIEEYALIGPNVCILSAGHRFDDPATPIRHQPFTYGAIRIGRDAWIGGGSVILQGVTVGEGAVVGAGSVISKNVPPWAVVIGNPGRIIKYRGRETIPENPFLKKIKRFFSGSHA